MMMHRLAVPGLSNFGSVAAILSTSVMICEPVYVLLTASISEQTVTLCKVFPMSLRAADSFNAISPHD